MNPKSKVKVFISKSAIVMNKTFVKMAENPMSDEYAMLQTIRQDYPLFQVRVREIRKNPKKETYAGLTYQYMRDYIIRHSDLEDEAEATKEFDELRYVSKCHSKSQRYPIIKKWFLAKYPEIAEFGMPATEMDTSAAEDDKVVNIPQNMEPPSEPAA